jgi:glycerophosphoryl diester phosphodiesterase
MTAPGWITARPIAHRGLHDARQNVIENTRPAFAAAVAHGFAIECDVQLSRDGEAVVHHDFELGRLTEGSGRLDRMSATELRTVRFRHGEGRIEPLADMLRFIAGRVPVIVEIKSAFDGDLRLTRRVVGVVLAAGGPVALKSFDPNIVAALRMLAPDVPRGIIAERHYADGEWAQLPPALRDSMASLAHLPETMPDFISYRINDLAESIGFLRETAPGLPLMSWTVRTPEQRAVAERLGVQIVFEGFVPA